MALQGTTTQIDITYVIDGTGSMTPIIDEVKKTAIGFSSRLGTGFAAAGYDLKKTRIRVVEYCDYATEGEDAIRSSKFFELPSEEADFQRRIEEIVPGTRGGDKPENGFEALYEAMRGDWDYDTSIEKHRQIIIVFTDAAPLPLGARAGCVGYPTDFPKDGDELYQIWAGADQSIPLDQRSKRLIVFGANETCGGVSWGDISAWDLTTFLPYTEGEGLKGLNLDIIVEEIVKTVRD